MPGSADGKADGDKTEGLSSGIDCGATDSCDIPPTTFSQLIKLGAKPQTDIVENMCLMCHTVSRQLTPGSLTTQPPLGNLGTDVEAGLLFFFSAELTKLFFSGHC